jgi:hypothetical protein
VSIALAAALVASACGDSSRSSGPPPIPIGLDALTDLAAIAEIRPAGLRVEQISSYDRTGGNGDLGVGPDTAELLALLGIPPFELDNSYLYREGDRYVVFDAEGPGVVARLWMTGLDALFQGELGGDIAFELDDEPTPRLSLTRTELFSGVRPPFLAPLAGDQQVSSGGFYSVVAIPFAHRLRITTSNVPNWVHVTYARLPLGTEVTSFDPAADTSSAAATLAASGTDPKGIAPEIEIDQEVDLAPGESATIWQREGAGTVLRLEVVAPGDLDIPTGLRLEARWDGAVEPQVDAPLDDVFAAALGPGARSLAFGRDGGRYYLYFPMPFRRSAEVTLRNAGSASFSGWRVRLAAIPRVLGQRPGYFHAVARSARLEPDGRDYVLLERSGTGHVVGVVLTAGCAEAGRCVLPPIANVDGAHLEGDERIAVDGSRSPQIHGTGLEDFFSGGFYFSRGAFTLPTHGNPAQVPETSPRRPGLNLRSAYRLFLADAIPFRSAIRLAIEHGPVDDIPAEMSSLVFLYALPEPSLRETDRIDLGDAASETAHALTAEGRVDRVLTSATRGDDSDAPFTAMGFEAATTRFRVAILSENSGVRLRRLADLAEGRQSAVVRVDGAVVGTWASAERNPTLRFADLDFEIPARFTRGRDAIHVEIDAALSPAPWTAYGYVASSYLEP